MIKNLVTIIFILALLMMSAVTSVCRQQTESFTPGTIGGIKLDPSLIAAMNDEAHWMMGNDLTTE